MPIRSIPVGVTEKYLQHEHSVVLPAELADFGCRDEVAPVSLRRSYRSKSRTRKRSILVLQPDSTKSLPMHHAHSRNDRRCFLVV